MVAKQLSIFLENKSGRLTEVTEVLAKEGERRYQSFCFVHR